MRGLGHVVEAFVASVDTLKAVFGSPGANFNQLLPLQSQVAALHVTRVETTTMMPCPYGLVHLFGDKCHPFIGLLRMLQLQSWIVDPALKAMLDHIIDWLRTACHHAGNSLASAVAVKWDT